MSLFVGILLACAAGLAALDLVPKDQATTLAETWPIPDRVRTLPSTNTKPTYYNLALKDFQAAFFDADKSVFIFAEKRHSRLPSGA
mgnify:CR=1 FL=1